jgi:subtilisin family serine protease
MREQILLSEPLCLHYVPHDSFLGVFETAKMVNVLALLTGGVNSIHRVDPAFKISPSLVQMLSTSLPSGSSNILLDVLCCADPQLLEKVLTEFIQADLFGLTARQVSPSKMVIDTPKQLLKQAVSLIIQHESVLFIDVKLQATFLNSYTMLIIKGNSASDNSRDLVLPYLNGEDEIIGVADTGLDFSSCYFYDPSSEVQVCRDNGTSHNCSRVFNSHRKIASYRYLPVYDSRARYVGDTYAGKAADAVFGHGTHVAGTIAGNAKSNDAQQTKFASEFNGLASAAKLAVDDLSRDGEQLSLPLDLHYLWTVPYSLGVRVHSNSWGSPSPAYTTDSMEADAFMHQHPDFLIVMAAGNDGAKGSGSLYSPATAKNVLAVGASELSRTAYIKSGTVKQEYYLSFSCKSCNITEMLMRFIPADFGFQFSADMKLRSGMLVMADPPDACSALKQRVNPAYGVVVNRGNCDFTLKARNTQKAGAAFIIVMQLDMSAANAAYCANPPCDAILMTRSATDNTSDITTPVFMVGSSDGKALKAAISLKTDTSQSVLISFPAFRPGKFQKENLAEFSSRGPTSDGRLKPDVLCPGDAILSACSDGDTSSFQCGSFIAQIPFGDDRLFSNGSAVTKMSGTSMATPACSAAASIVRQYFRQGYWHAGIRKDSKAHNPSAALLKAVLINGAQPLWVHQRTNHTTSSDDPLHATSRDWIPPAKQPRAEQGYGLIDLQASLCFNFSGDGQIFSDSDILLGHGQQTQISLRVLPGKDTDLRVTIVWTDPPSTPFSSVILVNNLDLRVRGPNKQFWYGNGQASYDEDGQMFVMLDDINNSEKVWIENAMEGEYVVQVIGSDVPRGEYFEGSLFQGQNFALIIRGNVEESGIRGHDMLDDCPSSCSGHGVCNNTNMHCLCSKLWVGADCRYATIRFSPVSFSPVTVEVVLYLH